MPYDNPGNLITGSDENAPFSFTYATASLKAAELMKEDFFWDPTDEFSPFGNDDGSDAAYGFRRWIIQHPGVAPLAYLHDLFYRWNYPWFDITSLNPETIEAYTKTPELVSGPSRLYFLIGIDNAIIAIAFAQLVLDNTIEEEFKQLALIALSRELLPCLLKKYLPEQEADRKMKYTKMISVLQHS